MHLPTCIIDFGRKYANITSSHKLVYKLQRLQKNKKANYSQFLLLKNTPIKEIEPGGLYVQLNPVCLHNKLSLLHCPINPKFSAYTLMTDLGVAR